MQNAHFMSQLMIFTHLPTFLVLFWCYDCGYPPIYETWSILLSLNRPGLAVRHQNQYFCFITLIRFGRKWTV